jgi:quercetin dioxygenase-like cupin family protein
MTETTRAQSVLRTGRPLDDAGDPTDRPALELAPDGRAATLLAASPRPLASSPGQGTWATLLERPKEGDTDRPVLVQWLAADASQPPPHTHPTTETFEAVTGELTVVRDCDLDVLAPGESVTVEPGTEHAFRNDTDGTVAFRARLPSMRTARALHSVWGMDHEGVFGNGPPGSGERYGEPGLLHGLLLAESLRGETTMTDAPLSVQRVLWATVGRVARAVGYRGVDERYLEDGFWERRVEQPDL